MHTFALRGASRSRNGAFILMIPILLATSVSCSDANVLIDKIKTFNVEEEVRAEMIQVVKEEVDWCNWDANV